MKKLLQGRIVGLNKRYWLAQTQWILFPGSPDFAEIEALMNRSVTGALWQHLHCADFPSCSFKKLWKLFLRGEAIASVVKNVMKTQCLRRTRWAAGEPRALQSSSWAKSLLWSGRILLCFFTRQYRGWKCESRSEQCCTQDGTDLLFQPELHCYTHCQVLSFHAHYLHFFDVTCLESCHQLAHTLRHCVPRLGTQMTTDWESFQPALQGCSWILSDFNTPTPAQRTRSSSQTSLRGTPNKHTPTAAEHKPSAICLLHTQINFFTRSV